MTDSQFETLRQDFRALRGDFDQRFDMFRSEMDQRFDAVKQRFDGVETRLTKLEVQLDGKPDKAFVFQTLFTVNASFIAIVGLALLIFRSFLVP